MHFHRLLLPFVASNSGKRYWARLDATSYQSSYRTVQHLCLWLQNELEWQFCKEFAPHPGGTNDNDAHACEPNYIPQCKIKLSQKYCPSINLQLWNFCHSFLQWMGSFFFLIILFCSAIHTEFSSQTWTSLPFVPPGWGANSSQSCRSCSFSGHKQKCCTVLSELR